MTETNTANSEDVTAGDCFKVLKEFLKAEKTGDNDLVTKRVQAEEHLELLEKLHKELRGAFAKSLLGES